MDQDYLDTMKYSFDLAEQAVRPGGELFWFACDSKDQIAVFSTAGFGLVPRETLCRRTDFLNAFSYFAFEATENAGEVVVVGRMPDEPDDQLSEWLEFGRKGLFAFDCPSKMTGRYGQLVRPKEVLILSQIPVDIQAYLQRHRLRDVDFADVVHVDACAHFECV